MAGKVKRFFIIFLIVIGLAGAALFWWRHYFVFGEGVKAGTLNSIVKKGYLFKRNSIGVPNIELLRREVRILPGPDGPFGFNTTATPKPALIDGLFGAFENSNFLVPTAAKHELQSYEVELGDNNRYKYSAPEGQHDDWVMALAILWSAMSRPAGVGFA